MGTACVDVLADHHKRFLRFLESPVGSRAAAEELAVCQCVHGLIPTLKGNYAGILRAVEMEGASIDDVAARLQITPGNAAVRLHRARQALRQRLETACGTCTEHGCLDCTCDKGQK